MRSFLRLFLLCVLTTSTVLFGQISTQQDLGVTTAPHMASGLGWNLGSSEIEFQAAAAAGATHVRLESCSWSSVEGQSAPPNNISTGYTLAAGCGDSLNLAKKYGLMPTVVAAYGAPYHQILTVTLPAGAALGATSFPIEYVSGVGGKTLASIVYPYAYLTTNISFTYRHSYNGALIAGVSSINGNSATLSLTSAVTTALAPGSSLTVNEILYPSALTGSPTDPSVVAYANYARYLAQQINAYGLTGDVELWNEPPWFGDCWDNRRDCYDPGMDPKLPGELSVNGSNFGFPAALQHTPAVPGVPYVWAGTNKTSSQSLMNTIMANVTGQALIQPQTTVGAESLHPYGNNPEDNSWLLPCLVLRPRISATCNTIPVSTSNMVNAEANTLNARQAGPTYGLNHVITETGTATNVDDLPHIARYSMRQYLGFMAAGVDYVEFYRLVDPHATPVYSFSFIELNSTNTAFTPLPSYTAMAGLMSDLAPMKSAPVATYTSASLPQVTSYSGTYDLDHLSIVGTRAGDAANSILYALWQRSDWQTSGVAAPCMMNSNTPCWGTVPQPTAAYTTVSIPAGMKVDQAINLDTRAIVSYSQSGSSITLPVSDDPIEVMFIPSSDGAVAAVTPKLLFAAVPTQTQGSSVAVLATSVSKGAITYSIASGPATISGNMVTETGPGTVTVAASQAAIAGYTSATATTSFTVTAITPTLNMTQVATRTYGDSVYIKTSSNSPGAVTLSILSGPATISGGNVTLTGAGTVVVQGSQVSSGVYTATTATTSFLVNPKVPVLVFDPISAQTFGGTLQLRASSASNGAVTYSVTSGPATLSGSTLSYTSVGQVVVAASQAASGGYSATTAAAGFHVGVATATLTFAPIATTPYNTAITVVATSQSPGPVVYGIGSGPARIAGSTVTTIAGSGTVVVNAYQAGYGGYGPASATTSFLVAPTVTPSLSFASVPSQTVGAVFNVSASSASKGAITYAVTSGPATVSGSSVTTTGVGAVVIQASQAASGAYNAASASTTVQVTGGTPSLTFTSVPTQSAGSVFNVSASSPSKGAVTYTVVSGPATVSGSSVTTTGAGAVVLQANQAASGGFSAATATTSIQISASTPALTFASIPAQTAGGTFNVSASSPSTGAITYRVVSGPATVSGSSVTTTGAGTVILQASQTASGLYNAATGTINVQVTGITPSLTFASIPAPVAGGVFTVSASSASKGAITYTVISGPATVSGPSVTATDAGTVVLQASQAASGTYGAATATVAVQVAARPSITIANIPAKNAGDVVNISVSTPSNGAVYYSVVSGPAIHLSGSTVEVTGAGTVVIQALQVASGSYPMMTAQASFGATGNRPGSLLFQPISSKVFGNVFTAQATAASPASISYAVLDGAATVSGSKVTVTCCSGSVTLQASQAASGSYPAASTTITFDVKPIGSSLAFVAIAPQAPGSVFPVHVTSTSNGSVGYKVVSGPATISGSVVSVTGVGTVVLRADQVASGGYGPGHAFLNVQVQ